MDHPILFSPLMVRAILAGRKSQTRRVVTAQTVRPFYRQEWPYFALDRAWVDNGPSPIGNAGPYLHAPLLRPDDPDETVQRLYPPWEPGDRLWVREAWRVGGWDIDERAVMIEYRADGYTSDVWVSVPDEGQFEKLWEPSSDDAEKAGCQCDIEGEYHWLPGEGPTRWRPSIHMPRWASRLTLEVTRVRAERIQDITAVDCQGEGASSPDFPKLWDRINGRRGYGWERNPWVWVLEFERVGAATDQGDAP